MIPARIALPAPVVLVAVIDSAARDRAERACRDIGAEWVFDDVDWISDETDIGACAAVWDLLPFESAGRRMTALRDRRPRLPVVLYPPDLLGVEIALIDAAKLGHCTAVIQRGRDDATRIAAALGGHLASRPERRILSALRTLFPLAPPRFHAATQRMLRRRASARRCAVKDVAGDLQISADRLGLHWVSKGLPGAKELADWMTRLYAARVCEETGCSGAAVARAMGLTDRTRRRLRLANEAAAPDAFERIFAAFAERCGLAEDEVRQALKKAG